MINFKNIYKTNKFTRGEEEPIPASWKSEIEGRGTPPTKPQDFQETVFESAVVFSFSAGNRLIITLAAATLLKPVRTSKWVWGNNDWVILLCVLRRSRSSHVWRCCRVSAGFSLDYG